MSDHTMTTGFPADGAPLQRLSDRLASLAPPSIAATLAKADPPLPTPSPRVAAALAKSRALAEEAARRARRPRRSLLGALVDSFVAAASFIPYALIALGLRLVMARVFFLDGQSKIEGPRLPLTIQDVDLTLVLPLQVKAETFNAFLTKYVALPVPPMLAAYLVSAAEFLLPICLLLGFATRISAFGLLIVTAMIQLYALPQALWTVHVYWIAILAVLLTRGPGEISIDHIIRFVTRR